MLLPPLYALLLNFVVVLLFINLRKQPNQKNYDILNTSLENQNDKDP